ncbi:DNA repair protein RecN [Lysobacteraceae bacterium NML120232]|nr:DNA repair protein RecN [Xanthomonadaceae bacterium NML120232]
MLTRLAISDFAVVQQAELAFDTGMTVISGETGAGKSLLVDALGFLCGQRADASVVRHGAERADLAAEFNLQDTPTAHAWLVEQEMDEDDGLCRLRRVLRADGGSKAWINGRMVSASQLAELSGLLLEIHGQHAQQALLARPAQLALVDQYGGHQALLDAVGQAARHWQQLKREQEKLNSQGDVSERCEYLRHQLTELEAEALEPDAIATLEAEHRRLAHGSELAEAQSQALALVAENDEFNALALLHRARHALADVIEHDPRLGEIDAMLESASISLDEAGDALRRLGDAAELDPAHFEALDARLQRLHTLARKHRVGMDELIEVRTAITRELEQLENAGARLAGLEAEIEQAATIWQKAAAKLTAARTSAATTLAEAVLTIIRELGMGKADFRIQCIEQETATPDPQGAERVEFMIAANPGQPPKPLRKVASGGELSRISLAIEVASRAVGGAATMIFDEVDTGISGGVAEVVGQKLRALGKHVQVMCVTHLPQVAAQGHQQWRVSKAGDEMVTMSAVEQLDEAGRVEEIARLLGGVNISDAVRAAARSLLQSAQDGL